MFIIASNPEALVSTDSEQKTCMVRLSILRVEFYTFHLPFETFHCER